MKCWISTLCFILTNGYNPSDCEIYHQTLSYSNKRRVSVRKLTFCPLPVLVLHRSLPQIHWVLSHLTDDFPVPLDRSPNVVTTRLSNGFNRIVDALVADMLLNYFLSLVTPRLARVVWQNEVGGQNADLGWDFYAGRSKINCVRELTSARCANVLNEHRSVRTSIVTGIDEVVACWSWRNKDIEIGNDWPTRLAVVIRGAEELKASDRFTGTGCLAGFDVDGRGCISHESHCEEGDEWFDGDHFADCEWIGLGRMLSNCISDMFECWSVDSRKWGEPASFIAFHLFKKGLVWEGIP